MVVRDSLGYGLTLSGDQPVFVQTVRSGGAADRAGIRENDVIVKVNGRRVTEASHTDVVNMIQGTAAIYQKPPSTSTFGTPIHIFLSFSQPTKASL